MKFNLFTVTDACALRHGCQSSLDKNRFREHARTMHRPLIFRGESE